MQIDVTFKIAVFGWTFTFCRRPFGVSTFTTLPLIVYLTKFIQLNGISLQIQENHSGRFTENKLNRREWNQIVQ